MTSRTTLLLGALSTCSFVANAQECPTGRPSRATTRVTWVEPYTPEFARAGLLEALRALDYTIAAGDSVSRQIVTEPRYQWPPSTDHSAWRNRVHPGVVILATIDSAAEWSSLALEVRALCETGDSVPAGWGPEKRVESYLVMTAYRDVSQLWRRELDDERQEIPGTRCAPLEDGDRKKRICRQMALSRPAEVHAQLDYALALIRFMDARAARDPGGRAITLSNGDLAVFDSLGSALLSKEEFAEAVRVYQKAVERWPDAGTMHRGYGRALAGLRKCSDALSHFNRAVTLAASDREAHYGALVCLEILKRPEEAAKHCVPVVSLYTAALQGRPRYWEAWVALGRCAALTGQHARAVSYFERAAQMNYGRILADPDLKRIVNRSLEIAGPQDAAPLP